MPDDSRQHKRRWRFYRTAGGTQPVQEFILRLPEIDQARIVEAMEDVRVRGLAAARHLQGDIYEVRATGGPRTFRILFAAEGRYNQVLLALEAFSKKTQKTPPQVVALAQARLADWRQRGTRT